jgi:hypothetical protein
MDIRRRACVGEQCSVNQPSNGGTSLLRSVALPNLVVIFLGQKTKDDIAQSITLFARYRQHRLDVIERWFS